MVHQIKNYSSIGGLMLHATHGPEHMAAIGRKGAAATERGLRKKAREEVDPQYRLSDQEFEARFRSWQSAYFKRLRLMRGKR